jgi:predicted alpha/beta hydrolase family esterase
LSVAEIRRLFWRLVLATKQTIGHILEWSAWRRWHQGQAQFYHYKQRAGPEVQL